MTTKLEQRLLDGLRDCLDIDDPTFSNVYVEDLEEIIGLPMTILRGVIGSLIKKDRVYIVNHGFDVYHGVAMNVIHLRF